MKHLIAALLLGFSLSADASPTPYFTGRVIDVHDGDTATVRAADGEVRKIRFYGIDAPETPSRGRWPAQAFSAEAKAAVQRLIAGKTVTVRLTGDRSYGRYIGEIIVNGRSVSRELVRSGLAWWSSKYEPMDSDLQRLEAAARDADLGLWQRENPMPPWEYRAGYRQAKK